MKYLEEVIDLDMNHVRLGTLDEYSLMVLFGNCHSRFLTKGLMYKPSEITDVEDNILYPAYFMTHLKVPAALPLSCFLLWDSMRVGINVKRYGETILDSKYFAKSIGEQKSSAITMNANSLFILDPSIYMTQDKQVSAPKAGVVCEMEKITMPPQAIQDSALVRTCGFNDVTKLSYEARPYSYKLELDRDTDPRHSLLFAKIPALIDLSEREFIRQYTEGKISEEALAGISLLERKIFYYGNAFAGSELTIHTRGLVENCNESLWKENPRLNYVCRLNFQSEIYDKGELLAISRAEKVIVHQIRYQTLIQDTKRLVKPKKMEKDY